PVVVPSDPLPPGGARSSAHQHHIHARGGRAARDAPEGLSHHRLPPTCCRLFYRIPPAACSGELLFSCGGGFA
ncbi:unnamed protein product, partial [Closterium sp. NIES-65]